MLNISLFTAPSLRKNIHTHHPGNPLGMYWKRIKPSQLAGFNTFPSAYPIDSQVVGMYVFAQCMYLFLLGIGPNSWWALYMGRRTLRDKST